MPRPFFLSRPVSQPADAYRAAGVDIEAGNALVRAIGPHAARTRRPGVTDGLGGFGAVFDPRAAGYQDPLLVAATDGVGTKLKLAGATNRHQTVGIDLVAMCVNDLVVQGAEPLFFLDYYATGHLAPDVATDVVAGIAEGCRQAGCALIGGETAEMPGMYAAGDYDLAGFCVGAVERDRLLTGAHIAAGDVVLGLASDGVHANGFSLVRRIVATVDAALDAPAPFAPEVSLGEALLTPTRIYVRPLLKALTTGGIRGLAHITGGGLVENVPRVLPEGLGVALTMDWPVPPVFSWLARAGNVDAPSMVRTFNCGVGMVVVCAPEQAETVGNILEGEGETVWRLGTITEREADTPGCTVAGVTEVLAESAGAGDAS